MKADNFYITLFSSASMKCFPNNTLTTFTVQLARPVVLGGNDDTWEVGLSEFTCVSRHDAKTVAAIDIIPGKYVFI
jgi:hypothetical protein